MLPMGTIMIVCMAIGAIALLVVPLRRGGGAHAGASSEPDSDAADGGGRASSLPLAAAGGIVLLGGLWNALWHAPRHIGQFWGQAALASGLVMLLAAALLLVPSRLPPRLVASRPLVLLALVGFALLYGVAISRL